MAERLANIVSKGDMIAAVVGLLIAGLIGAVVFIIGAVLILVAAALIWVLAS